MDIMIESGGAATALRFRFGVSGSVFWGFQVLDLGLWGQRLRVMGSGVESWVVRVQDIPHSPRDAAETPLRTRGVSE